MRLIHRLIAEAFIDNPHDYPVVNHKNGNKQDCSIENLEWCSHSHNRQHAYDEGLWKSHKAKPVQQICLSTGQVLGTFKSAYDVEKQTGIDASGVDSCCRNRIKKSRGFGWRYL